ncbi:MAG: ATP-binding protein [Hyphomicrobiales bacterium]
MLMTEKVVGGKPLAREVLEQIIAKTDGVPLFVEELTKTIVESGLIVETEDSYRVSGSLPELAIPATLHDSLMARLDGGASMREVAQVGACIGRQFSRELLAAVLALDETTLGAALRQLETAGLLFRTGTPKSVSYVFKHALVQDAAYDSLLKSRRKHFHARIAEVLIKSSDVVASAPEVLAHHYMEAGEFGRAATHWCEAAERAGARYANQEAIAHCRKGLTALSHLPPGTKRTSMELVLRIGLAAGLRITDRLSEALAELGAAGVVATASERPLELSRITICGATSTIRWARSSAASPSTKLRGTSPRKPDPLKTRRARSAGWPLSGPTHPASPPMLRGLCRARTRAHAAPHGSRLSAHAGGDAHVLSSIQ